MKVEAVTETALMLLDLLSPVQQELTFHMNRFHSGVGGREREKKKKKHPHKHMHTHTHTQKNKPN